MKEYIISGLIGFVLATILMANVLDDYSKILRNESGWVTEYDDRMFRLVEINVD